MTLYVVIGTSSFNDTSIAVGPFRSSVSAGFADDNLTGKGWNTETVTLDRIQDIPMIHNHEGA